MADTDVLVSELDSASAINTNDLLLMTQPDGDAQTGYASRKGTVLQTATKMLKGIEFTTDLPHLTDKTVLGGLEELSTGKANTSGEYNGLISGQANALKPSARLENSTPYLFRPSYANGYGYETLIGGTCGVNQLALNGNFADTTMAYNDLGTLTVSNNVGSFAISTFDIYARFGFNANTIIAGHKYLISMTAKSSSNGIQFNVWDNGWAGSKKAVTSSWDTQTKIVNSNITATANDFPFGFDTTNAQAGDVVEVKNCIFVDLTAYFGTTIADYVYTLESGTSGAGVAWLKNNGFFSADYYPYNAGGLLSVKTSKKINVGFNAWDEETEEGAVGFYNDTLIYVSSTTDLRNKNFVPVASGETYYIKGKPNMSIIGTPEKTVNNAVYIALISSGEGTFTIPDGIHYISFSFAGTEYGHDICINISSDLDGQYQPYVSHEYPLDDIELRGILKLDADNNLYYDGDTYSSSGEVGRKYGIENTDNVTFNYDGGSKWLSGALSGCNTSQTWLPNAIFALNYDKVPATDLSSNDRAWTIYNGSLFIKDTSKTENELRAIIADNEIVYELATPTTETADAFTNPMIVDGNGTEEFVDGRTVEMPVGHKTIYVDDNDATKLDNLPDISNDGNGKYLINQNNGQLSLDKYPIPNPPATDGSYRLEVTVTDGVPAYTWEVIS